MCTYNTIKSLNLYKVGQKQKKIDIDIPSIDKFTHQVYVNSARKLYTNIYLLRKSYYLYKYKKIIEN